MKKLVLILAFLTLPLSSYAQDAFYLSGMLGLTSIDVDNSTLDFDTELSYGFRAGLLFNDHVSAGLFVNRYATEVSSVDLSALNIMAEVTYYFSEADENTFWLSGLLGTTQFKIESPLQSTNDSETSYGFSAGYHFMVAPNFSLSPQLTYILINAEDSAASTSAMVNLTFWL